MTRTNIFERIAFIAQLVLSCRLLLSFFLSSLSLSLSLSVSILSQFVFGFDIYIPRCSCFLVSMYVSLLKYLPILLSINSSLFFYSILLQYSSTIFFYVFFYVFFYSILLLFSSTYSSTIFFYVFSILFPILLPIFLSSLCL